MASLNVLRDCLEIACEVHGRAYSENLLRGWADSTKSVSDSQIMRAWGELIQAKFPKPSDLLQVVAGVNPRDDWEVIMGVAQGRYQSGQISGYAAVSLKQIGGIRVIAMAKIEGREGFTELDKLHKEFLEGLQTFGGGLPAAPEIISLSEQLPPSERGTFVDSHGQSCSNDYCDSTGADRANALIKLLRQGNIKPDLAAALANGKSPIKSGGAASKPIPAAQRDRVMAEISEKEVVF